MYRYVRPLQVTSGKAQVQRPVSSGTGQTPVACRISPDKVPDRISSGKAQVNRQVPSGTGQTPVNHRTSPDKVPDRISSGKAQVNRPVSSGTGRVPVTSPVPPVKRRKTPDRDGKRLTTIMHMLIHCERSARIA